MLLCVSKATYLIIFLRIEKCKFFYTKNKNKYLELRSNYRAVLYSYKDQESKT